MSHQRSAARRWRPRAERGKVGDGQLIMARTRLAAEGAHMKSKEPTPPRWAEALLRSLVRPSDRESISGDLLEEYREVHRFDNLSCRVRPIVLYHDPP